MKDEQIAVAILAGGHSERFGSYKAVVKFKGRTLLEHMIDIAKQVSSRVLIVVSDEDQKQNLHGLAGGLDIETDPDDAPRCALTGALTAFEFSDRKNTLLLPVDTPLVNVELVKFLTQLADNHGAIVPRWPNGFIEPLHSVYLTEHAYHQGLKVMDAGKKKMSDMVDKLKKVLGVSTEALRKFDSDLLTFSNINTQSDLSSLEQALTGDSKQRPSRV